MSCNLKWQTEWNPRGMEGHGNGICHQKGKDLMESEDWQSVLVHSDVITTNAAMQQNTEYQTDTISKEKTTTVSTARGQPFLFRVRRGKFGNLMIPPKLL